MKKGWIETKLEDVCGFQNGFAFKSSTFKPTGVPIIRISNIQDDSIDTANRLVFFDPKDYLENLDRYRVVEGDLLIAMSGATTGKIGFNTEDTVFYLNQRVGKFEPREKLNKRFLYHFLSMNVEENLRISAGAAQPNLSTEQIKGFAIPLPPLAEQQRIVGLLDEAFEGFATAKANAEKNLQNARALFESHLQSVFTQRGKGWVEKLLGDVCETTQGVQIPKNLHFKSPGENRRRYLYISDFDHDENLKYVDDIFPKKRVTENDLIVVNTGATAGKIFRGIDGVLSNNLFKVTLNQGIDADFLYYFVTSSLFKEHQKKIVKGTANPHMGHENFKSTPVNIPPLDVQLETATKLDDLREETQRLARIYERKLSALAELKKSLLHQAFTGEL